MYNECTVTCRTHSEIIFPKDDGWHERGSTGARTQPDCGQTFAILVVFVVFCIAYYFKKCIAICESRCINSNHAVHKQKQISNRSNITVYKCIYFFVWKTYPNHREIARKFTSWVISWNYFPWWNMRSTKSLADIDSPLWFRIIAPKQHYVLWNTKNNIWSV